MALCELRYDSTALQKMTGAMVIVPEGEGVTGPFPVFYLLHGLSDDYTAWTRQTSIERYVEGLPLIVVMPDGGRGFYTDAREGFAYETAMVRDLIGLVDATFQTVARREGRVVGGLSMGGYGALKLALGHPDLFCAAVSHSGALDVVRRHQPRDPAWEQEPQWQAWRREMTRLFGPNPEGGPDDLRTLAERVDRALLPALRIDCGTEDALIEENRAFHAHLDRLGIAHEYAEFPGAHTWEYWDRHVQEAIEFHAGVLGLTRRPLD